MGVIVDRLPATVPPGYLADAFISVHADGSPNTTINGYKMAGPRRDYSGRAAALVSAIDAVYGDATGLIRDTAITRRMTAYYAFNWPRYDYAIHPQTPAAIVEMGFLTSPVDRAVIVNNPDIVGRAIGEGILNFLKNESSFVSASSSTPTPLVIPPSTITGELSCAPLRTERVAQADEFDCFPALLVAGHAYIIDGVATGTTPIGTRVTVTGEYQPIQTLENYFWFPYEVVGIFRNIRLQQ